MNGISSNQYMGKHKFEIRDKTFYFDDILQFKNESIVSNSEVFNNMLIFATNNNTEVAAYGFWKLYSFKIDQVRNFIPCYSTTIVTNADGVQVPANTKGLYDTVEGKFYTNQGTGEFIAGPEVD